MEKIKDHYANALVELSIMNGTANQDLEQSLSLKKAFEESDMKAYLEHVNISKEDKHKLFEEVFSEHIPQHLKGFMDLMVDKNKGSLIIPVINEYVNSINKTLGKIEAVVVSAVELSEHQIESIRSTLVKKSNMDIMLTAKVDPDIIGGFYIQIDEQIFDGTIRNQLNLMKNSLKKGSYDGI